MNKIREYVLIFNLALSPIVWFYTYNLGVLKIVIFLLLLFANFRVFRFENFKYFSFFFLLFAFVSVSLFRDGIVDTNKLFVLFSLIQNYCLFVLGFYYYEKGLVSLSLINIVVVLVSFFAMLTLLNLTTSYPNWVMPGEFLRVEELRGLGIVIDEVPLFSTGFGLGRTGWSSTLVQFVPLSLLIIKSKYRRMAILSLFLLLASIIISGSRGGIIAAVLVLFLYVVKDLSLVKQVSIFFLFSLVLFLTFIAYENSIFQFYRLGSDDITGGRFQMYLLIPDMVIEGGIWGLGYNGSLDYISRNFFKGLALHNVYFRMVIDYGLIFGCLILFLSIWILRMVVLSFQLSGRSNIFILSLILLGGLFAGLIEPHAIFEARFLWNPFWFFCGIVFNANAKNLIYLRRQ